MTSSHRDLFSSVDEKKALEQLEKFQREIQSARWKREQASAEFESFVKGFREGPRQEASAGAPTEDRPRTPAPSVVRALHRQGAAAPPRPAEQPPAVHSVNLASTPEASPEPAIRSETTSYSMRLQAWRGAALGAVVLAAIVLLAIGWWRSAPSPDVVRGGGAAATTPPARPAQPAPRPAPAGAQPASSPAGVAEHAVVLTTTRRVWVRVMADGHRLFEREVAAGERVPIDATQAVVIRAGDAGAVRLTFADGRVEALGGEGQVVTKRFEIRD